MSDEERTIECIRTYACRLRNSIERLSAEQERKLVADYLRIDGEPPQYAHGVADLAERMDDIRTARHQLLLATDQMVEEEEDDDDDDDEDEDDAARERLAAQLPVQPCDDPRPGGVACPTAEQRAADIDSRFEPGLAEEMKEDIRAAIEQSKRDGSGGTIPGPWADKG